MTSYTSAVNEERVSVRFFGFGLGSGSGISFCRIIVIFLCIHIYWSDIFNSSSAQRVIFLSDAFLLLRFVPFFCVCVWSLWGEIFGTNYGSHCGVQSSTSSHVLNFLCSLSLSFETHHIAQQQHRTQCAIRIVHRRVTRWTGQPASKDKHISANASATTPSHQTPGSTHIAQCVDNGWHLEVFTSLVLVWWSCKRCAFDAQEHNRYTQVVRMGT